MCVCVCVCPNAFISIHYFYIYGIYEYMDVDRRVREVLKIYFMISQSNYFQNIQLIYVRRALERYKCIMISLHIIS